jgi:tetratricopeptide (TPR) repeat protein
MNRNSGTRPYSITIPFLLVNLAVSAFSQNISEEAHRHFDRGIAAVETATATDDYESAIREFEQAVKLAPNWADAYYNLGMVQEKVEKFDEAIQNLRHYLRLSPEAADAEAVKTLVNKLEYKRDKANRGKEIIAALTAPGKLRWVSGTQQPAWAAEFRLTEGKLEGALYLSTGKHWVPVAYDGKLLEYQYIWYQCGFEVMPDGCPWKVTVRADIVSTSPLRLKNKAVWSQQYGERSVHEDEFLLEWVNDR